MHGARTKLRKVPFARNITIGQMNMAAAWIISLVLLEGFGIKREAGRIIPYSSASAPEK